MKYLVSAVNFSIKNWMLILPLFVLTALASLIGGVGSAMSLGTITSLANVGNYSDIGAIMGILPGVMAAVAGGGIIAFLAKFVYEPATYGLVNKSLDTGNASINDMGAAISNNFVKYIMYFVGMLVVGVVVSIAAVLILLLLGLILSLLKGLGAFLMVIIGLAVAIAGIVIYVLLSMWFAAMVVDGLDVVGAAKKSMEVVKSCFWTVLGITILIAIAAGIAGAILGFLARIPLLGPIIYSVVPAAQAFITTVFVLMLYREKTGRANAV